MSPTSNSSDDHTNAGLRDTLPPPELAELRSLSRHSNCTSISSANSCEDIHIVQSPDHSPLLLNGSHDTEINEFPSVGPPAGQKLQMDISTSDIYLETIDPARHTSPAIFIDAFDNEESDVQHRASPTAELCTADSDDIMLDASTNKIISKQDTTATLGIEGTALSHPDIDVLSQEILNEISMVGMSLNEEQFNALPDEFGYEYSKNKNSDLSALDQVVLPQPKHEYSSLAAQHKPVTTADSSVHSSLDTFPTALPSKDVENGQFPGNLKSSSNSRHYRYQDNHQQAANKMISSVAASDNPSQYHVHISPYASDSDSPKSTKRNTTNGITSHPLHNSRESPKSARQKHHSSPASAMEHQWRDVSPQLSDEPNEEFVLPPPPQFQADSTTVLQSSSYDVNNSKQKCQKIQSGKSFSSSHLQDGMEKCSTSTNKPQKTLRSGHSNFSTSYLMQMGNMDEEVLLTDMLESLDQMAEKKYREVQRHNSMKEKRTFTADTKAEKSEKKKLKKKAVKRRSTVGIYNFDDLIRQSIQENNPSRAEEYPQQAVDDSKVAADDSKVKKLAREYSKRAREKQLFNIKKRFSVHSYENFSGSEPNTPEAKPKDPSWKVAADAKREVHHAQTLPPAKRLPTIVSGSTDIGLPTRSAGVPECTVVSNDYAHSSSAKFNKYRSSPVMRSSSPIVKSRIEGFEKLSQSKDDYPVARKSESANPLHLATRGKTFGSGVSHVKSQENIAVIANNNHQSNNDKQGNIRYSAHTGDSGTPLGLQSRELSKSHGSLHPLSTGSSKSYRGLSVFSPESLDESDIIYKPRTSYHRDDFEHIRNRGGFKGWVKNLVDKFSK